MNVDFYIPVAQVGLLNIYRVSPKNRDVVGFPSKVSAFFSITSFAKSSLMFRVSVVLFFMVITCWLVWLHPNEI